MNIEESRQLAQDENTSPEKLRELANHTDTTILKNIVANPNIPPDVLTKLASLFPKQVFNNPALDLLLIETPDLFSGGLADSLCSLLKTKVPFEMLKYAACSTDERLKLAILMNPEAPSVIIKSLDKNESYEIQEARELHLNSANGIAVEYYREFVAAKIQQKVTGADENYSEIIGKINNFIRLHEHIPRCISHYMKSSISPQKTYPLITLDEVEQLIDSKKSRSLIDVARNPHISTDIIRKLLKYPNGRTEIAKAIATNPATPTDILEELAKSIRHHTVHSSIARNPRATADILEILLDNNSYSDYEIGRSPNINEKIIAKLLSKSSNNYIAIFYNSNTPVKIKRGLLEYYTKKQTVPIYRYRPQEFISDTHIPSELLEKCIANTIAAIKDIKNPTYTRSKEYKKIYLTRLKTIAFHPNLNSNSLTTLLDYENSVVRSSAIANYKTPQYITKVRGMSFLNTLSNNELKILANSFYATDELLRELVNHQDITISRSAASNPCRSSEILAVWENSPYYKPGSLGQIMLEEQRLLERWSSSISAANRLTVLLNPQAPIEILAKISRSISWLERYAITQNPKTPYPIITRLMEDGNRIVRAAAEFSIRRYSKQAM